MRSIMFIAAAALALPASAQVTGATGSTTGAVAPPSVGPVTTGGQPPSTATGTIAGGINTNTASGTTATTGTSVGATGSSTNSDMSATTGTSATAKAKAKSKKNNKPGVDAAAAGNSKATGNTGDLTTVQKPHR